jgi:hypothetical protein
MADDASHTDDQVLADLRVTEREVVACKKVLDGWSLIAAYHLDRQQAQLAHFRMTGALDDVRRGERLLEFLRRLARLRGIGPSLVEEIMAREG